MTHIQPCGIPLIVLLQRLEEGGRQHAEWQGLKPQDARRQTQRRRPGDCRQHHRAAAGHRIPPWRQCWHSTGPAALTQWSCPVCCTTFGHQPSTWCHPSCDNLQVRSLQGKDHTLFALSDGMVVFSRSRHTGRRSVSVDETHAAAALRAPLQPRIPTHLLRVQRRAARAAAAGARM